MKTDGEKKSTKNRFNLELSLYQQDTVQKREPASYSQQKRFFHFLIFGPFFVFFFFSFLL